MKASKYNYFFRTLDNCCGVFNTFSGAIATLSSQEEAILKKLELFACDIGDIEKSINAGEFLLNGFILPDDIDEQNIIYFDNAYFTFNNRFQFRILPTTLCNARCPYCYEAGIKSLHMDVTTAENVCNFIKQKVELNQRYHIEWFGGEPLLNQEVITFITNNLISHGYTSGTFSMVSNGLLFNEEVVEKAKSIWNLSKIQITLDGLEERYNKTKSAVGINNPFETICQNMLMLADSNIQLIIRLNFDNNFNELAELIHLLGWLFKGKSNISFYIYPLFELVKSVKEPIINNILELNNLLIKEHLMSIDNIYQLRYRHTRCFASCYNSYTIAPDGKLYNCSHIMNDNDSIGSITNYNPYNPKRLSFIELNLSEECKKCIFLPMCKGGCRVAELKMSPMNQCILYKNVFDKVLQQIVKGGE